MFFGRGVQASPSLTLTPKNIEEVMVYPSINSNIIVSKASLSMLNLSTGKYYKIQETDTKVLSLIDGIRSISDIYEILSKEYKVDQSNLEKYFEVWSDRGFLTLKSSPVEAVNNDWEQIRVASVELTDRCNLKCRYCYGDFHPQNKRSLSMDQLEELFISLRKKGCRTVELSGGEPTVLGYFDRVVEMACQMFQHVTIMTNAVHFSDNAYEIFKRHKEQIGFSISIDGFSEETNAFQRGVANTFEKTLRNIIKLKKEVDPFFFRIVYMLTNENKHELDAFFSALLDKGIDDLLISIPEHIEKGRTYCLPDGCDMSNRNSESRRELLKESEDVAFKYQNQVKTMQKRLGEHGLKMANTLPSCGAGWAMISIKSDGRVLPCNMMDERFVLGNCLEDTGLTFLSRKNRLYGLLSGINLSGEDDNRSECLSCQDLAVCNKCVNMVLIANQKRIKMGDGLCPVLSKNGFCVKDFV